MALKFKWNYDDSLDVVGVHFVGGVIGVLLIGLLADAVMTGGPQGLLYGGGLGQLGKQLLGMAVVAAYAFTVSYVVAKAIDKTLGFRLSPRTRPAGWTSPSTPRPPTRGCARPSAGAPAVVR